MPNTIFFPTFAAMKTIFVILGSLSLALGILGIVLPLLPTTPFLLLSAALYLRSSPRLYNWLINHKYLGSYIRNYLENKTIPIRIKVTSITVLWATIILSSIVVDIWYVRILLLAVAVGVSWHILSHPSS